jgi:excisionase family DNA binding protein
MVTTEHPLAKRSSGPTGRTDRDTGWLSLHEVAVVLQVSVRDVTNMVRRGGLTDVRPGRRRGVAVGQVLSLVVDRPLGAGLSVRRLRAGGVYERAAARVAA